VPRTDAGFVRIYALMMRHRGTCRAWPGRGLLCGFACSLDPAGLFAASSRGCCARTGPACQSHEPRGIFRPPVRTSWRLAWLIRVKWRIGGSIMHPIDRTTRIHHDPGRRGARPGITLAHGSASITSAPPRSLLNHQDHFRVLWPRNCRQIAYPPHQNGRSSPAAHSWPGARTSWSGQVVCWPAWVWPCSPGRCSPH